jgi:hypothetical protein
MGFNVGEVFAFMGEKVKSVKDGATSVVGSAGDYTGDFNGKAQGAAEIAGNFFRRANG